MFSSPYTAIYEGLLKSLSESLPKICVLNFGNGLGWELFTSLYITEILTIIFLPFYPSFYCFLLYWTKVILDILMSFISRWNLPHTLEDIWIDHIHLIAWSWFKNEKTKQKQLKYCKRKNTHTRRVKAGINHVWYFSEIFFCKSYMLVLCILFYLFCILRQVI